MLKGLLPIFSQNSKKLILGSFPSVISRNKNFYYSNKRNRFWNLMCDHFNTNATTIEEKTNLIIKNNLALWDIVNSCENVNSSDSNLKNISFVDLMQLIDSTKISKIGCNGTKSFSLTKKYFKNNKIKTIEINNLCFEINLFNRKIIVFCLPSTSPANLKFDKTKWIDFLNRNYSCKIC